MTTQNILPRERSAARFAVIGGLTFLLVAACASAFSMLIWDPVVDPAAVAAAASGRSGRIQPDFSQRVENFGRELGARDLVLFDPRSDVD
jgi:hypothetical protein